MNSLRKFILDTAIYRQAARALDTIWWLALYGLSFKRAKTVRLLFLAGIGFLLQGSLALAIITSTKLISGETIAIRYLPPIRIENATMAIVAAMSAVFLIMMLFSVISYVMSVQLRALGRAIHVSTLREIVDRLDQPSSLDALSVPQINRLVFQASLHFGIGIETLFRLTQPALMIISATLSIIYLDPWVLPLIVLLALPLVPLFLQESRKLVRLSETFHGHSSRFFGGVVSSYVDKTRSQNIIRLENESKAIFQDPLLMKYLDDYDAIVLSNNRMSFITSAYRPFVFAFVIGYLAYTHVGGGDEASLALLPILFAIFYLSNGGLALVSLVTNLIRFLPQVRLVRSALSASGEPAASAPQSPSRGALAAIGSMRDAESTAGSDAADSIPGEEPDRVFLCYVGGRFDREKASTLKGALAQPEIPAPLQHRNITFLSKQFLWLGRPVKTALSGGRSSRWHEVERMLVDLGYPALMADLPDREETVITSGLWSEFDIKVRSLFRLMPVMVSDTDSVRAAEYDSVSPFDETQRQTLLDGFALAPLLLYVDETMPPKELAARGLVLTPDGRIETGDYDWFVARVEELRTESKSKERDVLQTSSELLF